MSFIEFLYQLDSWVWGMPLIVAVMLLGAYYMIRGKFFPFVHFGHTWKNTIFKKSDQTSADDSGKISPFRAFCLALGGAVGMANISGVATSIAVGGPGAIFWMWVWAFFSMMVKIVETSLGLYYRRKGPDGKYSGSAMDYMERGIAGEMGLKFGKPLAILFAISLLLMVLQGSGAYTVGETMSATFGLNLMAVVVVYILFIVYLIFRGENTIGRVAEKIVPFMCGVYLLGTVVILILNAGNIPGMFADIFKGAFTGTAAAGGFAGSAVATAIRQGVSRSVYSNEAGNGTSPLIHGSANTVHPVRQGLWGSVEVFCDTLIVCTCSGLAILITNTWTSGESGATLGVLAFTAAYGSFGKYFLGIMTLLFAFTTSTTWYLFYRNILSYLLKKWPAVLKAVHKAFTVVFPLIMVGNAALVYYSDSDATLFWTIVSIFTAFPLFINAIALFVLRKKFWTLLDDYKARYLSIGQVDPSFSVFAEDDPEIIAKINQNLGES